MSKLIGKNSKLQLGFESAYGTAVTPTAQINHTSESLKLEVSSKSEETLIGGKTYVSKDIMGWSVTGDVSSYARPEEIGYILGLTMGTEAEAALVDGSSGAYEHVFTLIGSSESDALPSATIVIDRKAAVKAFTGIKADSLSLDITAGDYLKATVGLKGKTEEAGTLQSLSRSTLKALKFVSGSASINGSSVAYITGAKIDISNSLDDGGQTLGSGLYNAEYSHADRDIKVNLDVNYNSAVETLRENYFKEGDTIAVVLNFESSETIETGYPYSMTVTMPLVFINDLNPVISDKGTITASIDGTALEDDSNEPITISIVDSISSEYIS